MSRLALTALAAFMAAATPAMADPMYTATDLGQVIGYSLNDAGQVVGQSLGALQGAPTGPGSGGFLYDSYGPNAGTMYLYNNFQPSSINASGEMAGSSSVGNGGFAYGTASGQVTPTIASGELMEPGMTNINASGQTVIDPESPTTDLTQAYIVNPDGSRVAIGTPPNQSGFTATAINDQGQVVGYTGLGGNDQAYVYSAGTFHSLGSLPGADNTMPVAINDAGQVVGNSGSAGGNSQGFLYSNGTMQALPTLLEGGYTTPYRISNSGVVYGDSNGAAFLYANGQMLDLTNMLHSLTGPISQAQSCIVESVNDAGQILVLVSLGNSDYSFLLTPDGLPVPATPSAIEDVSVTVGPFPTPEPSALALFVFAAFAIRARALRSRRGPIAR